MATIFILFAALFMAACNFFVRREVTEGGDRYIIARFITAGFVTLPIIYLHHAGFSFDPKMGLVAAATGICLGLLQFGVGKSLQYGPPGLTFILVTSVCIWPPLIMFVLFGEPFGHGYGFNSVAGALLVVAALYWMGKGGKQDAPHFKKWLSWITLACLSTTGFFTLLQWRALLVREGPMPESALLPFHSTAATGDIFMVITFFVAALCQLFIRTGQAQVATSQRGLLLSGLLGGLLSAISTYCLMLGTECAVTDQENAIIFPLNTVMTIIFCNAWAVKFYKEKVNWPANGLAFVGIAIS